MSHLGSLYIKIEHFPIEKQQGTEGLILSRSGDLPLNGQMGEKCFYSSFTHLLGMALIVKQAESRTTRSWDISIRNCVREIQTKNKRCKAGGYYLMLEELRIALEEA